MLERIIPIKDSTATATLQFPSQLTLDELALVIRWIDGLTEYLTARRPRKLGKRVEKHTLPLEGFRQVCLRMPRLATREQRNALQYYLQNNAMELAVPPAPTAPVECETSLSQLLVPYHVQRPDPSEGRVILAQAEFASGGTTFTVLCYDQERWRLGSSSATGWGYIPSELDLSEVKILAWAYFI